MTITMDQANQPGPKDKIFFYAKEYYMFDNFTAFEIEYDGHTWATSEHAYQAAKYKGFDEDAYHEVRNAKSSYDAFLIGRKYMDKANPDWNVQKFPVMREIIWAKVNQHPYVKEKLLETGDREIIEDSWVDSIWGWGPNKDGQNHLGKIWMEIREELKKISS